MRCATIGFALLCVWATGPSCGRASSARAPFKTVYSVATYFIPEGIDVRHNRVNAYQYLLWQLYYPLFSREQADARLASEFLDMTATRALEPDFSRYQLCLRPNLRFSDDSPVTAMDLRQSLRDAHSEAGNTAHIVATRIHDHCVEVTLDRGDDDYFDHLTSINSTILKTSTKGAAFPIGLGPYALESRTSSMLRLTSTYKSTAFRVVAFQRVADLDDAMQRGLDDFNLLYWEPNRAARLHQQKQIERLKLRSYGLIVSHDNERLRQQFSACLNLAALRDILALDLIESEGWLPQGVLGHDVSYADTKDKFDVLCDFPGVKSKIIFYNPIPQWQKALERFFSDAGPSLPWEVIVQRGSRQDMIAAYTDGTSKIFPMGVDSFSHIGNYGDPTIYFDLFYLPFRVVSNPPEILKQLVQNATRSQERNIREHFFRQAHRYVLETALLIPLGQMPPIFFQPLSVRHSTFADQVAGYPRIDLMEANIDAYRPL